MEENMKKLAILLAVLVSVGVCFSQSTFIVYDNTLIDRYTTFQIGAGEEVGDEILLDNTQFMNGTLYSINYFSFTYWGANFSGNEQMRVKFYKNDGASGKPNTVLWDSDPFNIPATGKSQVIFDDLNLTITYRNLTWAVQFLGLESGESAGLWIYSPPAVGGNYTDYWYNDGSGWELRAGTQAIDFEAKIGVNPIPPTVTITAPTDGGFAVAGNPLTISANAADPDGWISKVEFYVDGTKVGEDTTPPYSYTWTAGLPANIIIYAKAIDSQGQSTESSPVGVQVVANSPPSFVKGSDITVDEDSGPQTFANWATSISPGPAYESHQTVSFIVQNNNNALFSVQPAVSSDGTLTFTPAPNANGSAIVAVVAKDDGGTLGGGQDMSAPQTFTITVNPVNDPPVVQNIAETTQEDVAIQIQLLGSDIDGDALTYSVVTGPANGSVTINGSIATYTPNPDFNGTDSFEYRAFDGSLYSTPATVTITVTAVSDIRPSFFAPSVDYLTEQTPIGIATGDFIKDGKKDIAVACAGANAVVLYKGVGFGDFQQVNIIPISGTPVGIVAADFDYNGKLDLAVTVQENKLFILYNIDNLGNFNVTEVPLTFSPIGLVSGRFDADNYADLACLSAGPDMLNILYNGGSGIIQFTLTNVTQVSGLAVGDYNRDGRLDIAFIDSGSDKVGIVRQNSDRSFTQIAQYSVGSTPKSIVFSDLNGDYRPDIVVGNADSMSISVLLAQNNATNPFVAGQTINLGLVPSALAIADLDKDGYKDLLVATEDGLLLVLKGGANGTFTYYPGEVNATFAIGSSGQKAIVVDELNNDANIDAVVGNSESDTISILLNNRMPKAYGARYIAYEDTPIEITLRGTYGPLDYMVVGPPINGTYEVKSGYSLTDTTESPVIIYTPNPDFFGNDTIMFMTSDGINVSSVATIYIRIRPVNDQPSFDILTTEITVDEDSGIKRIQNFAYNIDRGGGIYEARQSIKFIVTNDNPDLFSRQPTINYLGELSFMPKRNAYGTANVTAYLRDSGGSNVGIGDKNTSEPKEFVINVQNVNDPPVISRIVGTYVINRNSPGAFSVYVSDIETAAADLTLTVTSANQSIVEDSSFSELNYGGIRVIQFTPVPDASGRVLLTFVLDDGTSSTSKSIWLIVR